MSDIAYEGRGTGGPALLLLHGFPLDRRMWRSQLGGLGELARLIAIDLPGFGDSPAPSSPSVTMDVLADAVMAVADGLHLDRMIVAGLSMGGYVALSLARRYPDRLSGLILLDTRAEADTPEAREARHEDADRIAAEGTEFFIERMRPSWLSPAASPELVREVETMARRVPAATAATTLRGLAARLDQRPILASVGVRSLVLCGADDPLTPPDGMRALAAAIPGAHFARVPGAHFAPLEHPVEVNTELAAFLSR